MALDMWAPWPGTINKVISHGPWARHSPWTHGPWASETMPGPWAQDDIHNSPILLCVYIYIYIQLVYDLQVMQPPAMTSRWTPVQTPTPTIPTGVKTTPHGSPTNGIGADAGVQIARLVCSRKKKWHACT